MLKPYLTEEGWLARRWAHGQNGLPGGEVLDNAGAPWEVYSHTEQNVENLEKFKITINSALLNLHHDEETTGETQRCMISTIRVSGAIKTGDDCYSCGRILRLDNISPGYDDLS